MGVIAKLRMPTHKGEGTWAPHSLTWLGRPLRHFWGSGPVVFWGFWVRCGRVKLVSSSLGSILGVIAELRMPTHRGEGTWATHSLSGLGIPLRKFLEVRCGRVKLSLPALALYGGQCRITDAHP